MRLNRVLQSKTFTMKTVSINHEILLFTATTFAKRDLCELNEESRANQFTPTEQLEAACWNNLLDELLPEIMPEPYFNSKLFLTEVVTRKSCIKISMGVKPSVLHEQFTLDPYVFLFRQEMN